jgi:hypothetical protein
MEANWWEKRVLRMFGPMTEEVTEGWKKCIMRSFIISRLITLQMLLK